MAQSKTHALASRADSRSYAPLADEARSIERLWMSMHAMDGTATRVERGVKITSAGLDLVPPPMRITTEVI